MKQLLNIWEQIEIMMKLISDWIREMHVTIQSRVFYLPVSYLRT